MLALFSTGASAATASLRIERVFYTAAPGETNHLTISLSDGNYVLSDSGAAVEAGAGCTAAGNYTPHPSAKELLGSREARRLKQGACAGEIVGTLANDLLSGTAAGESLFGLEGDDTLSAGSGDDCVFGGNGSDRLSGGKGADRLLGDDSKDGTGGDDRLAGNSGRDLLVGGTGSDRLAGGAGKDRLSGNGGNDSLKGGKGNDRLKGGAGRNRLSGGPGSDRIDARNGEVDQINCGRGRDFARVDRSDHVRGCEHVSRR